MARLVVDPNAVAPPGSPAPGADDFKVYTSRPLVGFLSRAVQPPSQVYIELNDLLTCSVASSIAGESVTVSYRILKPSGEIVKGQFRVAPGAVRVPLIVTEPTPEGFLLSVSCSAKLATTRGQTFVRLFLSDPAFGAGQPSYMLMADYVTNAMGPGYPYGRILAPSEGPGNLHTYQLGTAALGTEWLLNLPVNMRWNVIAAHAVLNTSAAVGNRLPGINLISGGNSIWFAMAQGGVAPSNFADISASPTATQNATTPLYLNVALPAPCYLVGQASIGSNTLSRDAGDEYSNINVLVEEWLDNV